MIRSIRQCMTINAACPHNGMVCLQNGCSVNRVKGFPRLRAPEARSILCLGVSPLGKKLARGVASLVESYMRRVVQNREILAVGFQINATPRGACCQITRDGQSQAEGSLGRGWGVGDCGREKRLVGRTEAQQIVPAFRA